MLGVGVFEARKRRGQVLALGHGRVGSVDDAEFREGGVVREGESHATVPGPEDVPRVAVG